MFVNDIAVEVGEVHGHIGALAEEACPLGLVEEEAYLALLLPEDQAEVEDHIAAGEVGVPFLQTLVAEVDPVD